MAAQTIVVTHDDPIYLEMVQQILVDEGYPHVISVLDSDALTTIRHACPDLILVSMHIGHEEHCWHLIDMIRLDPSTQATPVVICITNLRILHAHAERVACQHCLLFEVPFTVDDLVMLVQGVIGPPPSRSDASSSGLLVCPARP